MMERKQTREQKAESRKERIGKNRASSHKPPFASFRLFFAQIFQLTLPKAGNAQDRGTPKGGRGRGGGEGGRGGEGGKCGGGGDGGYCAIFALVWKYYVREIQYLHQCR